MTIFQSKMSKAPEIGAAGLSSSKKLSASIPSPSHRANFATNLRGLSGVEDVSVAFIMVPS
jgi:hypothetical protein